MMKPDASRQHVIGALDGDWQQGEYTRIVGPDGRPVWLLCQVGPRKCPWERPRRVSVLSDTMEVLFRVQGSAEADKPSDPVVIGLETALESECRRRLLAGDWGSGTTYEV